MLNESTLKTISGGANWWFIGSIAGGIVTFLVGLFEGFTRPLSCHS